jgi:hypothetical protein
VFRIKPGAAKVALIRAARSTLTFGRFEMPWVKSVRALTNAMMSGASFGDEVSTGSDSDRVQSVVSLEMTTTNPVAIAPGTDLITATMLRFRAEIRRI